VLILESKLGLSPWDVLNQGLAKHTPLSFGMANVAVGLTVLLLGWWLGGPPGFGTFANAILIGAFIQGLTAIHAVTALAHDGLSVRIPLLVAGHLVDRPRVGVLHRRRSRRGAARHADARRLASHRPARRARARGARGAGFRAGR